MKKRFAALALAMSASAMACNDHELQRPDEALLVVESSVSTAQAQGPMLVTVIGQLKNTTDEKIDNLVLEARLTDAAGKVIDVLSEPIYGLVVPPGEQVSFRLQGAAATTHATYANAQVRVVSAESHAKESSSSSPARKNQWVDLAVSWGPMLLLVLVWIYLTRKQSGKGSYQDKLLNAMNEQTALLTRQSAAVEAIAAALSSSNRKPE
jgi:ATP-dependent Zn protease